MISVVIHTYNSEKHLRDVLETVKDFDEILICDMESTDTTLEIAKQYNCRVVTFPKKDYTYPEPARDYAIHEAKHPWVLVLDSDETITNDLKTYLYNFIKQDNDINGIRIPRKNYFLGRFMHGKYPNYQLRFFKKSKAYWPPYVHTQVQVEGKIIAIPRNKRHLAITHLENDTVYKIIEKANRYTNLEIERRKAKKYGIISFIWRPFYGFFDMYIKHGGFLDGKAGYIYAKLESVYQIVMLSKIMAEKLASQLHFHQADNSAKC